MAPRGGGPRRAAHDDDLHGGALGSLDSGRMFEVGRRSG
jgi:hypothetical protein